MKKNEEYLQYELTANALNPKAGEGSHSLRVVKQDILSESQTIDQIHALMPDVPRELIVRMRACEDKVFVNNARAGRGIRLPIVTMTHTIHGPRKGANGSFNRATDSICVNMLPGEAVAEAGAEASVFKVKTNYTGPVMAGVTDMTLKSRNGRITRGGYIRIRGARLELMGPQAAVLFMPADGSPGVKADLSKVLVNKPSEVILLVPDNVPLGPCRITHTTHYTPSGGKVLTTPHTVTFDTLLTVV
jgi:hypothetical protein